MIRRKRLNESTDIYSVAGWQLEGVLISDAYCEDWIIRRTISGRKNNYEVKLQLLIEKDFTGGRLREPEFMSLLRSPRKFNRLEDAIDFADSYKSFVYSYMAGEL
jgi:hypothetical protein